MNNELKKYEELEKYITRNLETNSDVSEKLCCKMSRGNYQYYINGKYVSKSNIKQLKTIAEIEYFKKLQPKLKVLIKDIKNVDKHRTQFMDIYYHLHGGKQALVDPVIKRIEDIISEFETIEYEPGEFENTSSEQYSAKGERVRSRIEKIIADELYRRNIPYHYEMPLELRTSKNVTKIFRPDFTVINIRTGKRYIWEHLGMMDSYSYYNSTLSKLDVYEKNNLLIGRDVILTHDSGSALLSSRTVDEYIDAYLV